MQIANRIRRIDLPVLKLEMRVRQRKARPFIVMLVYAGLLSLVALAAQRAGLWPQVTPPSYAYDLAMAGRQTFRFMSYIQLAIVCLIGPAYSAAAINRERERGTLDMLSVTLLPTPAIVLQKLAGALAEIAILLVTSLPILAIVFMLGGVSPVEVALVYLLIASVAVVLNAAGVFWSCVFKDSRTSMFVSYACTIGYILVLPILASLAQQLVGYGAADMFIGCLTAYLIVAVMAGGVTALLMFSAAGRFLRQKPMWRTRALRMGVLGGLFSGVLLVQGAVGVSEAIIQASPSVFELPMYMNPFTSFYIFDTYSPFDTRASFCITLGLAVTGTYLFQRFSIVKLDILRRS